MKAEEFMIGDWVTMFGVTYKIAAINKSGVRFDMRDGFSGGGYNAIEPIPITPEFLEKNEIDTVFKTRYKGFYLEYHAEAGMIMLYVYNNDSFQPMGIGFKYVHQLQHALRLCEIEKEIIL